MPTVSEIKTWYDKKYLARGKNSWRAAGAYPIFLDYLSVSAGKKILDAGCGTGYLLKAAHERGLESYGIDISAQGVKIASVIAPESHISVGQAEQLEFSDNFFDYVTCLGVLEHFSDMEKGLQEMKRVAKPGASLCIMVPNSNFLYWKLKGASGTDQADINERLLSLHAWKKFFAQSGLEIVKIHKDKWFKEANSFGAKPKQNFLRNIAGKIICFLLPLKYTYQFIFILRKP